MTQNAKPKPAAKHQKRLLLLQEVASSKADRPPSCQRAGIKPWHLHLHYQDKFTLMEHLKEDAGTFSSEIRSTQVHLVLVLRL